MACLERDGYHALRVSDICQRARVSNGTFYLYFQNKREIAFELASDLLDAGWRQLEALTPEQADPFTEIMRTIQVYVEQVRQQPGAVRSLLQLVHQEPEFHDLWQRNNFERVRKVATDLIEAHNASQGDRRAALLTAYALAAMADGFLHGLVVRADPHLLLPELSSRDLAEVLAVLWHRCLHCAGPDPARLGDAGGAVARALMQVPTDPRGA